MKSFVICLRMLAVMTVLLGGIYPLAVTLMARTFFPRRAAGSLVYLEGQPRGSELIAQNFTRAEYFWPRPSAVDFNPLASGGSNLGPTAKALTEAKAARAEKLRSAGAGDVPEELIYASASGLDPHITLAGARFQEARIAAARKLSLAEVESVVMVHRERRYFGFIGEEVVNVLALNFALDKLTAKRNSSF